MKKILLRFLNRIIRSKELLMILTIVLCLMAASKHFGRADKQVEDRLIPSHTTQKTAKDVLLTSQLPFTNSSRSQFNETDNPSTVTVTISSAMPISTRFPTVDSVMVFKNYQNICEGDKSFVLNEDLFTDNAETSCAYGSSVVFMILSHLPNANARDKVRQSWCSIRRFHEARLTCLFFIYIDRPQTDADRVLFHNENEQYFDMVFIREPFSLRNEVKVHLQVLQYAVFACRQTDYFVFVHDTVFVNVPTLLEAILNHEQSRSPTEKDKGLLLCTVRSSAFAIRNRKSAWFVSKADWPDKHYPPHCDLNRGLLVSYAVARDILMCASVAKRPFWINDIFITGVVPRRLGIDVEDFMSDFSSVQMKNHFIFDDLSHHVFLVDGKAYSTRIWALLFNKSLRDI